MSDTFDDVVKVGSLGLIDDGAGLIDTLSLGLVDGQGVMNTVNDLGDQFTGKGASNAARDAAQIQAQSADKAIAFQRESRDLARSDLSPFVAAGQSQLNPMMQLLTPNGQFEYLQNNPMFQAAVTNSGDQIKAAGAAQGKYGSGGMVNQLFQNYLGQGESFIGNQFNRLFNTSNMGQSSAAGQANTAMMSGQSIGNLMTDQGAALAGGVVGAQGARQQGFNNLLNVGGQLGAAYMMSDKRLKKDIVKVGSDKFGNIYEFAYTFAPGRWIGRMAQELREFRPDAVKQHESGYYMVSDEFHARAI